MEASVEGFLMTASNFNLHRVFWALDMPPCFLIFRKISNFIRSFAVSREAAPQKKVRIAAESKKIYIK
jgi:hypothetical protein